MTTIQELEEQLKLAKQEQQKVWQDKTGVKCMVVKSRIIYYANNEIEVSNVLKAFKPYETSHKLGDNKNTIISNPYRIDANNNYYDREVNITFKLVNNEVCIKINLHKLSAEFKSRFISIGKRGLYETETHYVNLPYHYKKFKDIRIESFGFGDVKRVNWYGGNITLCDAEITQNIINYFYETN